MKHTPGPWEIGYFVKSDVFANGGTKWIATLVSDNLDGTEEDGSNAQLVASAPDLLEACITVVKGYEGDGMEQMGPRDEVFYKYCKDAITKAKGGN